MMKLLDMQMKLSEKTQGSSDIKDISKMFRADDRALWKNIISISIICFESITTTYS